MAFDIVIKIEFVIQITVYEAKKWYLQSDIEKISWESKILIEHQHLWLYEIDSVFRFRYEQNKTRDE